MTLFNVGRVAFNFKVEVNKRRNARIEVIPNAGTVAANERLRLSVRFTPTSPDRTEEQFTIRVAHFPPENIIVFGEGIFHHLTLSLPRFNEKGKDCIY